MNVRVATALGDAALESAVVQVVNTAPASGSVIRRCRDVVELRTAALTAGIDVAVIDGDLRGLDRDVVAALRDARVRCLAVADQDVGRLIEMGVAGVVGRDLAGLADALRGFEPRDKSTEDLPRGSDVRTATGRIAAVWGPTGAPGRTTVAIELAVALASSGADTLVVDADTVGPSVAQHLGLIDDTSGFAAAVRAAARGRLDPVGLAGFAVGVPSGPRVLVGLPAPDRWSELRPASVDAVLACARSAVDWTVVDVGFGVEGNDVDWADPGVPVRYGAARTVLAAADVLVCVGRPDPIGLVRLIKGVREVRDLAASAALLVVLNHVTTRSEGVQASDVVASALNAPRILVLAEDRRSAGSALAHGVSVTERNPRSPFVTGIGELARQVLALGGSYDEAHGRAAGSHRRLLRSPHRRHRHRNAGVV